jgi:hypothetical protein
VSALLVALLLAAAPDAGVAAPRAKVDAPRAGAIVVPPARAAAAHPGGTACGACHVSTTWADVRFNHERTGFSLTGRHARASCKGCHVRDFTQPLARTCASCHADVHAGEVGVRCEGCHDTTDWKSRLDVDAHRRTNFPLLGAHAMVPCVECHLEARERRFSRATVECQGCHQGAVGRTTGAAVDHAVLGFDTRNCRECHSGVAFKPARFVEHDGCFPISGGDHAGLPCLSCHSSLASAALTGSCTTMTAACTGCHEHRCSNAGGATETDRKHEGVPGYQCQDRKCYECHRVRGAP